MGYLFLEVGAPVAKVIIHVDDGNASGFGASLHCGNPSRHGQRLLEKLFALLKLHVIDDIDDEKGNRVLAGVFGDVVAGLRFWQNRPRYDTRRAGARAGFCTRSVDNELGALRCAPSSTPTPSRSTSSPPNQPATRAMITAAKERARPSPPGVAGSGRRRNQLPAKSSTTRTFKPPCHNPIALARVLLGIPIQSISPKTAAKSPPIIPAPIMYHAIVDHFASVVLSVMMSKITEVASKPKGKTMSMGCTGCPAIFISPPKQYS